MNKRAKALIILLTPFLLGFLLGLLIGGGCSRKEKVPKEKRVRTEVVEQQEESGEEGETAEEDDVDGTGESEAREIIYYTKLMTYGKVFDDVNDTHLEKAKAVGLRKIPEKRDDLDPARLADVALQ